MSAIDAVLQLSDLVRILGLSTPTIRRRLKDARAGIDPFPLPVGKSKQKLLWDRNAVLKYLEGSLQPAPIPKVESVAKRNKRHTDAMRELEIRHGIQVKPRNTKEAGE